MTRPPMPVSSAQTTSQVASAAPRYQTDALAHAAASAG
jgi:hypothetical protein